MKPTKEQIIEWTALVHEKQSVHGWDKEEIRQVLESDPDALNSAIEFASLVAAAAYTKGREDMRDTIMDEWDSRIQADLEHGVRSLNEKAAAEWRKVYPAMADFSNAVRALPIQKGCEE